MIPVFPSFIGTCCLTSLIEYQIMVVIPWNDQLFLCNLLCSLFIKEMLFTIATIITVFPSFTIAGCLTSLLEIHIMSSGWNYNIFYFTCTIRVSEILTAGIAMPVITDSCFCTGRILAFNLCQIVSNNICLCLIQCYSSFFIAEVCITCVTMPVFYISFCKAGSCYYRYIRQFVCYIMECETVFLCICFGGRTGFSYKNNIIIFCIVSLISNRPGCQFHIITWYINTSQICTIFKSICINRLQFFRKTNISKLITTGKSTISNGSKVGRKANILQITATQKSIFINFCYFVRQIYTFYSITIIKSFFSNFG